MGWAGVAAIALLSVWGSVFANTATAAAPQVAKLDVSKVSSTAAMLEADINPQGLATHYHFEYGPEPCASAVCTAVPVPDAELAGGSSPVRVKAAIEGLSPATIYYFRVVASNGTTTTSPSRIFATYSATILEGLPEGRGYEQASPLNKDGGDAVGSVPIVKAALDGSAISFDSTFGVPDGVGAQELPTYLAKRSGEPGSWATQGLLPPELLGERAQVLGWLPDYSKTYSNVTRLGNPRVKALVEQSTDGKAPVLMTAYVPNAEYSYAGATEDGSVVFFESKAKLPPKEGQPPIPGALEGAFNLYAWDEASGEVHLAGVLNNQQVPGKGAFAGPYAWGEGTNAAALSHGGGARSYYLQDGHAVSDNGSVYFTAAGIGQLYLRENPTRPQSEMEGEKCLKPEDACTVHVSASKRTTPDSAGPQPAAFQAASADGSKVFFTSLEELTDDANTGPEQPEARISRGGNDGNNVEANFIPKKAVGVAVDGEHVYWANPSTGAIGRANLDGTGVDDTFIAPPPGECEVEVEAGVSKKVQNPSIPRYVAVDGKYIYWTNAGLAEGFDGFPVGGGTIGRAKLNGEEASIESDFICGASNPQGIAVNAEHIYWANASQNGSRAYVSRANLDDGSELKYKFIEQFSSSSAPYGVALDATHVYYSVNNETNNQGYVFSAPLGGGESDGLLFIGQAGVRSLSVDATHVYWASQSEEAIGRAPLDLASKEKEFIKVTGKPAGLAADSAHLYWSINGEAPVNPGNDLYLYEPTDQPGGTLEDLTPEPSTENGAEVQGVVGASKDGSRVFFVANGDLDGAGPAAAGDCHTAGGHGPLSSTSGQCNLYLRVGGTTSFIARVRADGGADTSDAANWLPTPRELFGTSSYAARTSFLSPDGKTLLFRSTEQLSAYENEGTPELYRYREGDPEGIRCVSCPPAGQAAGAGPSTGSVEFPVPGPRIDIGAFSSRILSADGDHVFFESAEALSPLDTNGQAPRGCPLVGKSSKFPACLEVYEWAAPETPGTGCAKGGPNYSPLNAGCIYLISTGKSEFPSLFADASASGNDVFFFTRQQLVGQDKDGLQDVYDARVGGGLASQSPATVIPCESTEACHGPVQTPPSEPSSGGSATFVGPSNPAPKRTKPKKTQKKHKTKKHKHKGKAKKQRANAKGRASR